MPEGHTIHRYARLHRKLLRGKPVRAWSPQGRFAGGAARLDGQAVMRTEAYGKHLLYHWGDGAGTPSGDVLHVHLGLFGRFLTRHPDDHGRLPEPSDGTRLALQVLETGSVLYLAGATVVELITPEEVPAIVTRLGPDPLHRGADPDRFVAGLRRRSVPIAVALLDQGAIAGIGNVYRAELLFRAGLHPSTPANEVTEPLAKQLWDDAVELLRRGERSGRIITVDPADVGRVRRSSLPQDQQRYVYKRHGRPCHRCGTEIASWTARTRTIWACPTCQPRR